jgi:hypothetical protein
MPRSLLALIAVVAALMLAASAFGLASIALAHTEERSRTIAGTVTRVEVDGASGDVALMAAAVPDVTIHERRHYGWRKPTLAVSLRDGVLRLRVRCASWAGRCGDDLDIVVPRAVLAVRVGVQSGDVSLGGLSGGAFAATSDSGDVHANRIAGTLTLHSDSGDVEAGDVDGAVELRSDSGDVHGHGLRSARATAFTASGDVALALEQIPDAVQAATDSGDVDVRLPSGDYRVDAATGSGSVHLDGVARDDAAPNRVQARTDSGDVTVRGR